MALCGPGPRPIPTFPRRGRVQISGDKNMTYRAPLKDMLFNIRHLAGIEQIAQMPGFEDSGLDTAQVEGAVFAV